MNALAGSSRSESRFPNRVVMCCQVFMLTCTLLGVPIPSEGAWPLFGRQQKSTESKTARSVDEGSEKPSEQTDATTAVVSSAPEKQGRRDVPVAKVSPVLARDPAYNKFASLLIEIDFLADPVTSELPLSVENPEPGVLSIRGSVPTPRVRQSVLANARRISGLMVRDGLDIAPNRDQFDLDVARERLELLTRETISALFPESEATVKTAVDQEGTVVLTGSVATCEARLLLSRAMKSQPGTRSVVNLLQVPADASGRLVVTEDGRQMLAAADLPIVPTAPPIEIEEKTPSEPSRRSPNGLADDAPEQRLTERAIRDDVQKQISSLSDFIDARLDVEVSGSTVVISGDLRSRDQVERLVNVVSEVPGVFKVVAKCRPFAIQRTIPKLSQGSESKEKEAHKVLGFLPGEWFGAGLSTDRRFRDSVRKSVKNRCEKRVSDVVVRETLDKGLVIEGEVANRRDLVYALKQIDGIVELRGKKFDVVLRVEEL